MNSDIRTNRRTMRDVCWCSVSPEAAPLLFAVLEVPGVLVAVRPGAHALAVEDALPELPLVPRGCRRSTDERNTDPCVNTSSTLHLAENLFFKKFY